ncbi:MAG: hypothetical protein WC091_18270 [Sulfuricellaceae bacterium]
MNEIEMEKIDKCKALDVIEDVLTDIDTSQGCGIAIGLCGAFYMCGLLSEKEWQAFLERIPAQPHDVMAKEMREQWFGNNDG